jgi:thiol-disulfide isomerase/thioredoxin
VAAEVPFEIQTSKYYKICYIDPFAMKKRNLWIACLAVASAVFVPASVPETARVTDLSGQGVSPLKEKAKAVVLVFLSIDCPISNSYAPELARLNKEFSEKGITFNAVYPNKEESTADIREHLKKFAISFSALRDPDHELVKASEVKVTPEVAVFVPDKGLVYHGRIDDRYVELGRARPQATKRDLRVVLQAILSDQKFESYQKAVGCYISDSR